MSARRRQKCLLNPKRLFEQNVALRGEAAVAGKFRRSDGCADVIKFISRRERTIKRNADHDGLKGFRPINKSDPPAGKETPFVIIMRSSFKMLSKVLLSAGLISNSRHGCKSWSLFRCIRDQIISGSKSELKEVIRSIWKPA